jgi:hypothetical protein
VRSIPRLATRRQPVALGRRRKAHNPKPPKWLEEFIRNAYEPTPMDFLRIRAHIHKRRKIYENNYRDQRQKVFATKMRRMAQKSQRYRGRPTSAHCTRHYGNYSLTVGSLCFGHYAIALVEAGHVIIVRSMQLNAQVVSNLPLSKWE